MIITIVGMIALTLAAAFWLARRGVDKRVVFGSSPDGPCAFGCGMAWLAVRSDDPEAVLAALRLEDPRPCNWNSGVGSAYDDWLGASHVFVSPAVRGWTFVVGLPLPHPVGRGFADKCTPLLVELGGGLIGYQDGNTGAYATANTFDSYWYWNAGLALAVEKITFDFRYWDTSASDTDAACVNDYCDARFVFSAKVVLP